jgi:signal transduction histidine kinase
VSRGEPLGTVPEFLRSKKRTLLFLRWVVIVTASYLVLFDRPLAGADPRVLAFIAIFLTTNLVASALPTRAFESVWLRSTFVLFDTCWISLGMYLAGGHSSELFLLYFSVLFLAALGENEAMIAGGCALIALLYLLFLLRTQSLPQILKPSVLLRFPFLVGIATFYGYLVTIAKQERRAAEMARARERFRTDLLATLTHDLQTPLSAIAGMADLLLADLETLDEATRRNLTESIKKAATESSELVATFLAMASAEAGAKATPRQLVDLNAVVKEALHHQRRAAAEKEIRLEARLVEHLPAISGDRGHLHRAISNLLWNAVKFVPVGGHVELATGMDGSAVTVTVTDNGPGIPAGVRQRLFEPYVSEGEEAGTGLGLFIVRLIAEAHGGAVTLQSQPGKGSRFTLRFPIPADVPLTEPLLARGSTSSISMIAATPARARLHS